MSKEIVIPYSETRSMVDNYTILNCEHKRLLWRMIGHTAMIYRDWRTNTVYVYESTKQGDQNGVQLHLFGDWLMRYPGKVYARVCTINGDRPGFYLQRLLETHIRHYRGTSYPDLSKRQGRWFLIKAAWDSELLKKQSTNPDTDLSMFCTHLVGHAFRHGELTTDTYRNGFGFGPFNPAELQPDNTRGAEKRRDGDLLERYLRDDVMLSKEIRIK